MFNKITKCQFVYLILFILRHKIYGFNIDTVNPIYRFGPRNTYFGFSIAQHFTNEESVLVVGAPRAESGQPGTTKAGAVFSCPINFRGSSASLFNAHNCSQLQVEYPTEAEFRRPPQRLNSKILHSEGKNHQLLGFVVQSTGLKYGNAMVCAPLLRYGQNAYTDGACYLLSTELNHTGVISTCNPLPKKDRHNDYGACEQGFSGYIDKNVILTGLPGARKWTGGVFGRYEFTSNGFPDTVDRWTMEVNKDQNGIINILASHDYLGYSIGYGRFGFWYEELDGSNFTIVSGATRYQQTGAVVFLPFYKNSHPEEERLLGLDDNFTIVGQQLGSGFGAAIQVIDLNADGFDDLIVSAPYEFYYDEDIEFGGAVYVIYSAGQVQKRGANREVFREPIILRGKGAHSQFGIALTKLGNLDNDLNGYQDFAVGAPQTHDGQGAVYIYHGAEYDSFQTSPAQAIYANTLKNPFGVPNNNAVVKDVPLAKKRMNKANKSGGKPLRSFGAALAGGVDMDGNYYNELAVGAFGSDTVIIFRARPVVDVELDHIFPQQYIKIDDRRSSSCPSNARTCFALTTRIATANRNNTAQLLNFDENPFICFLEVISYTKVVATRALFVERNKTLTSWACGRNSLYHSQEEEHKLYVPQNNQDWTHPLRFNFTVAMRERSATELLPIINKIHSEHIFEVSFDKKCGDDNDCHTDLTLSAILLNITRRDDGAYVTKVTERDVIVIRFVVENKKERAFFAKFYIEYDQNELDEPQKLQHKAPIDIERKADGLAVISLGNPLEEGKKLTFDLSFNLVRGSSERVSASLNFKAHVNSTSIEDETSDNDWQAEVQLIKEADLQLDGASLPLIVRFSKGNPTAIDEEDIGQQVVHVYTLTNHGPFYAKNVTVTIHWPLRLNTERGLDDWALYTLEEPVIRHSGEIRKCRSNGKEINPLNIYNDETLRLTYEPTFKHIRHSRSVSDLESENKNMDAEDDGGFSILDLILRRKKSTNGNGDSQIASIFDGRFIKPKEIEESSGSRVRIVDVNCKDQTALCVPIVCNFDYVGTNDAALIEIRSRLWNSTFSGSKNWEFLELEFRKPPTRIRVMLAKNYKSIEYFSITSDGFVEVDVAQGIIENIHNNFARVTTHAYPDRPLQDDRIDIWIILLAILAGLLLLSILILVCWRCGFFKRKRSHDPHLHQANRLNELEQWQ